MKKIKLDDLLKSESTKVPEGYFERLPNDIIRRINEEEQSTQFLTRSTFKVAIPIAAALALFTLIGIYQYTTNPRSTAQQQLSSSFASPSLEAIGQEEIAAYLMTEDLTMDDLFAELEATGIMGEKDLNETILDQELDLQDFELLF